MKEQEVLETPGNQMDLRRLLRPDGTSASLHFLFFPPHEDSRHGAS